MTQQYFPEDQGKLIMVTMDQRETKTIKTEGQPIIASRIETTLDRKIKEAQLIKNVRIDLRRKKIRLKLRKNQLQLQLPELALRLHLKRVLVHAQLIYLQFVLMDVQTPNLLGVKAKSSRQKYH